MGLIEGSNLDRHAIPANEVHVLCEDQKQPIALSSLATITCNAIEARTVAREDVWFSLLSNDIDCVLENSIDSFESAGTSDSCTDSDGPRGNFGEGLRDWKHSSLFTPIDLEADYINVELSKRFV